MAKPKVKSLTSQTDKQILVLLGKKVREARERKKLQVYDITGEDMPIKSRQHWQAIENGQKNVNITTAFKIARTLDVPLEELVKGISLPRQK